MKGICPVCNEVGTRRISVRTLKNGKERWYLGFLHKRGDRFLSHYVGVCTPLSPVTGIEDFIDQGYATNKVASA